VREKDVETLKRQVRNWGGAIKRMEEGKLRIFDEGEDVTDSWAAELRMIRTETDLLVARIEKPELFGDA